MSNAQGVEFSLKVMMNKEKTKVLFADVDSDFADVLLSFLTLPLGTIVRLLQKHYGDEAPHFRSLTTLYNSLADLDDVHFWTEGGKLMLLNPRSPFQDQCSKLKLNIDDTEPTKYFFCEDGNCDSRYVSLGMYYGTARCPRCGRTMNREASVRNSNQAAGQDGVFAIKIVRNSNQAAGHDGVFTIKTVSFLISDDLRIVPIDAGSFIKTLSNLGVTDTDGAVQRTVTVGFNEIMDLLKLSLLSRTPLTDLVLRRQTNSTMIKSEPGVLVCQIEKSKKTDTSQSENLRLKVMVQESTNRFLFAQAKEDFTEFLFSFLAIPLAGVEWLLGSKSCLKNIDNLYSSSANNDFLKTDGILVPELSCKYLSKNQLFSLSEQRTPQLYRYDGNNVSSRCRTPANAFDIIDLKGEGSYVIYPSSVNTFGNPTKPFDIIDPKGEGSYVTGPRTYMVTDDLTVTPLCMSSSLSILSGMKIQLSDVKEVDIDIGLEEALSILKASLTSTCALTDGLNSILNKQPTQEA